ncbi:hypothetical protein [Ulvibacterium marinum]|uniref:Uncharacterized protein n=1 Tax=Ulvibacterium marinum TaxID=2419782 RepID=A0A3B0CFH6_9FLAO|nr:hypothetical protein [Ulvibacterium marinum]RKN81876.1 hypothetical protein D7Z94_11180 [Ulvibacterium marinum]
MLLKRTNIEERLGKTLKNATDSQKILDEVFRILEKDQQSTERIQLSLSGGKSNIINHFDFDLLDTHKIYHLAQIKQICIDYRLRFLDSKYFKGEIPNEVVAKIKKLEKEHGIEIKGYKIIAPSKLFKLADKDDPLLLVPIGNNYFYLIHKWGNDLHPFRKSLMWPFKSILNLTALILVASYLVTFLVPNGLFSKSSSSAEFWIIYFFMFKSIAAVVIFYGFALGKNFNPAIWNSKYFNA